MEISLDSREKKQESYHTGNKRWWYGSDNDTYYKIMMYGRVLKGCVYQNKVMMSGYRKNYLSFCVWIVHKLNNILSVDRNNTSKIN